jgi:hypothetical protein
LPTHQQLTVFALTDVTTRPEETTYAIAHASTALLIKRRFPRVGLWPLLIAVQFVELLWVLFSYLGIEHAQVTPNAVHLDFIPYSHSIGTGLLLAGLAIAFGRAGRRTAVGTAVALGVLSHVVLDIIQHEPNIALLPMAWGPRIGFNLQAIPLLDFIVELLFCIGCWKVFGGTRGLLIGIVLFNLINLPLMFPPHGTFANLAARPAELPTVILLDIVATWLVIWVLARSTMIPDTSQPPLVVG